MSEANTIVASKALGRSVRMTIPLEANILRMISMAKMNKKT